MSVTCPGFVPHGVKPNRCRKCFRDISEHKSESRENIGKKSQEEKPSSSVTLPLPRRRREVETVGRTRSEILRSVGRSIDNEGHSSLPSARSRSGSSDLRSRSRSLSDDGQTKVNKSNETEESDVTDSETTDSTSSDEVVFERSEPDGASEKTEENETDAKKAKRIKIVAAKEVDKQLLALSDTSIEGTSPDVEFIFHVKTSVKSKNEADSESVAATETTEATETTLVFQESVEDLQSTITSLKKQIETLEEKCTRIEKEKKDMMHKRAVSEADKHALEKTASDLLKLRAKISELESKNEELKEDNKYLKAEVKETKMELNKREPPEQVELRFNMLQDKLHQTETLCEDLMEENDEIKKEVRKLEVELEELHDNFREDQASEFRDLKRELEAISKNCRVLQFKLRKSEKKCEQLEMDKSEIESKLKDIQATAAIDVDQRKMKNLENELKVAKEVYVKMQDELIIVKETNEKLENENDSLRKQVVKGGKDTTSASEVSKMKDGVTPTNESLMRDLYDGMERENDLREQLNFAEEESKVIRRKLSTLEQENEILMMQLKKMTTSIQGKGKGQDDKEEFSVEELKLHLDLSEQEMSVLRRKVDEIEQENDNLQSEIKYLQDKLVNQPMTNINIPDLAPSDKSSPTSYYEHKMKLLEYEAKELRKKLIDKDKENDRLQTEVQVYRRKASKVIVRSRSLDSDSQVDLKRQLQLVEQEATMLRQKTIDLENENEKLTKDNKRLQLRVSRKPPLDSAGELQIENLELKNKIDLLEKKYTATQEELERAMSGILSPTTIIQDYKPRKESLTESENELIASLKKRLKTEEDENSSLKTRIVELEIQNNKMVRDQKKVKDALNYKKKPPKIVRDTVTRMELREIVSELQDEISDLQVTLRGREAFQETMEEELEKYKKEASSLQKELLQKEDKLNDQVEQNKESLETLRTTLNSEKMKGHQLQRQLEELASKQGISLGLLSSVDSLKTECKGLTQKVKKLENDVKNKEKKCKDLQEEVDNISAIKEDFSNNNALLNTRLADLEKEIKKHKQLLSTSEEKLLVMQTTLDDKNKELTALRKECNYLKTQIDEERVHLKIVDDRQMEVTGTYLKERDNLKQQLTDMHNENKDLKEKLEQENKDWQNKVKELKTDYDKRKEMTAKEIQDKMKAELKVIGEQEKSAKNKVTELTEKLEKKERMLKDTVDKHRNLNNQFRRDRDEWQSELSNMESKLRSETRKQDRLEKELEQIKYQRDEELLTSRDKIVQLEREQRKAQMQAVQFQEQEQQIKQLEKDLEKTKNDYDEITSKYEQLEEDFVGVKSRLVAEKEEIQSKYSSAKQDYNKIESKMKTLQETFDIRKERWEKERMELQEKIKDFQMKSKRFETWDQEKQRMKDTIEEKNSLIESYKKEERHLKEERERLRRRLEESSKKLSETERNERSARSLSVLGRSDGLREDHRAELSAMKENYESRMASMASEMQNMQSQIISLCRERDQFREKLLESEKNTKEILTGSLRREKMAEMTKILSEEEKLKLEDIHDQLDDALLENKNLKLQYETDKNSWEIEMSELHSKINQLEEQKLLESTRGSSRAYAKTRLELAWEKERNEQVRALSDSKQIMSSLRTKLINVEKQHDKEKRDMKKRLHEFKAAIAKEHEDIKKKMSLLHTDNITSRTAYEKVKTQYEWLWQDKVKMENDLEKWKTQLTLCQEAQNKLKTMSEDMEKLTNFIKTNTTPEIVSSLERRKSYSRLSLSQSNSEEIQRIADMMKKKIEEIKTIPITIPEETSATKSAFRRAVSVQDVGPKVGRSRGDVLQRMQPVVSSLNATIRPPPRQKSLNRKSLSLDHAVGMSDALKIWDSGDESNLSSPSGSQLSLKFGLSRFSTLGYESDSSLPESEYTSYSTGSKSVLGYPESSRYQNELPSRESSVSGSVESVGAAVKPKKTLKEKLKMLRTQSVEIMRPSIASEAAERSSLSSTKTVIEEKEKSLRSRISKVLKKPLGRSNSIEAEQATSKKTQHEETATFRGSRHSLVDRLNVDKLTRARSVDTESATTAHISSRSRSNKQTPFSETPV